MLFEEYLDIQMKERYRAFILVAPGKSGKTVLWKKTAHKAESEYMDYLEYVCGNPELEKSVETISPAKVFETLEARIDCKLLLVDHLDFLFSIWTTSQQKEFLRLLNKKSNGTCIAVTLHNYKLFNEEEWLQRNSAGMKRIINIIEFA
jgi:hypothetical protein